MAGSQEIRYLKLQLAKARMDHKKRQTQVFYWIFIPAFLTILIYMKEEIGAAFATPFVELLNLVSSPWGDLVITLLFIIFGLSLVVALSRFSSRIVAVIEQENDDPLRDFEHSVQHLVDQAEDDNSPVVRAAPRRAPARRTTKRKSTRRR